MAAASPPLGSITDVPGLRVGHTQRTGRGWQTGTTVILAPDGATPGVDVRGGGPGTRETDALSPENLVQQIHAVCLTGGSAFGLAAAHGVVEWLETQRLGFPVGPADDPVGVVPVVPAAVVFDLGRGGNFANRPDAAFGRRAADSARARQSSWGAVGAGCGARAGGLQGGVGTASTVVTLPAALFQDVLGADEGDEGDGGGDRDVVVGALAVVNANGSPIDHRTGLPWVRPAALRLKRPAASERRSLLAALTPTPRSESLNTTIGVVATSADMSKAESSKLASVAHDGLARAIQPAHSMFDGDTIFGLATGDVDLGRRPAGMRSTPSRQSAVNAILTAAADTFAAACVHAVVAATTIGEHPAYFDICGSARSSECPL